MILSLIAAAGINYGAGIIGWIIIGLIAGALAGMVMRGGGYGIIGDIVVGIIGALIGGFILSLFGIGAERILGHAGDGVHWRLYSDRHPARGQWQSSDSLAA